MAEQTLWTSYTPTLTNENDATAYNLGTEFYADAPGWVLGVKWRFPNTLPTGSVTAKLWGVVGDDTNQANATELASATFSAPVAGAVNEVRFASPVPISANVVYVVSIRTADRYVISGGYFGISVDNGNLHAPANGTDPIGVGTLRNGKLNSDGSHTYPHQTFGAANYWVDVIFTTDDPVGTDVDSSDAGTGTDAATLGAAVAGSDTGTGTQAQSLATLLAAAEQAVMTELQTIGAQLNASDSGVGTEGWTLVVVNSSSDTGTGTENTGAPELTSSDSATGTETQSLAVAVMGSDSANALETTNRQIEGVQETPQHPITIIHRTPQLTIQRKTPGITIRR